MKFLAIILFSMSAFGVEKYPDLWWKPVLDKSIPNWEILPQSASRANNEVILSKRNELGILSNFAATPFSMLEKKYASLEGLWQSMKYPESASDLRLKMKILWPMKRAEVEALTAFDALKAGKAAEKLMLEHNFHWVSFNGYKIEYKGIDAEAFYDIIEAATRAKIDENPEVKRILMATGDLKLRPDHFEDKDGTKAWKYYDIYIKLRAELKINPNKNLYNQNWFEAFTKKYKTSLTRSAD